MRRTVKHHEFEDALREFPVNRDAGETVVADHYSLYGDVYPSDKADFRELISNPEYVPEVFSHPFLDYVSEVHQQGGQVRRLRLLQSYAEHMSATVRGLAPLIAAREQLYIARYDIHFRRLARQGRLSLLIRSSGLFIDGQPSRSFWRLQRRSPQQPLHVELQPDDWVIPMYYDNDELLPRTIYSGDDPELPQGMGARASYWRGVLDNETVRIDRLDQLDRWKELLVANEPQRVAINGVE